MKVILKQPQNLIVVVPETAAEEEALAGWKAGRDGHVFHGSGRGTGLALVDLGPQEVVCRVPINVTSKHPDPVIQLIGNFADAPFDLDRVRYQSVESFWQSLKFDSRAERLEVAAMPGGTARRAGEKKGYGATVRYDGRDIVVGTWDHWQLMERACRAKFDQNEDARAALLGTGTRPLEHRVRRDSRTIPGVVMADIWMRIRRALADPTATADEDAEE